MQWIRNVILVLLILVSLGTAQNIGGVFLGLDNYLPRNEHNFYDISATGPGFGFLIPIHIPQFTTYFKLSGSHHSVGVKEMNRYNSWYYPTLEIDYFVSVKNELLVGKTLNTLSKISLVPQLGIGLIEEALIDDWEQGSCALMGYLDLSLLTIYDYSPFDLGLLVNLEHDFWGDGDGFVSDMRLNVGIVILK